MGDGGGTFESLRRLVGGDVEREEESIWDEFTDYVSLSKTQRLYGFGICFSLGVIMSFLSALALPSIITGNAVHFAVPYTLGNILSLGSTSFIVGPMKQLKNMCDPTRAVASIIYIAAMAGTLFVAIGHPLKHGNALVVLALLIIQLCALVWYTASYIPFARRCIRNAIENFC
eukprot:TRINITY_DN11378_c0_g1::TRINITY_DN11378_c0_g1_i1::g.26431::m.26431 TRINITY_DN11378_c0_g1::TRINITY_DN11378_c0_g1_i1::g.26431  ORF type:complete len:173 (-),score=33.51,sp/Q8VD57/SFT2B_MOUSE/40.51/4e-26,Got1/PF04178.7/4.9e-27 TRINITY_DN11378_c0_g1_i1:891-1409(-)